MSPRMIPNEALPHFENLIYLPMLMTILTRDKVAIESSTVKFIRPYLSMIDNSLKYVKKDLRHSHEYLRQRNMRLLKGKADGMFTEYIFYHQGYEDVRRYLNHRLRNHSEVMLDVYLSKRSM